MKEKIKQLLQQHADRLSTEVAASKNAAQRSKDRNDHPYSQGRLNGHRSCVTEEAEQFEALRHDILNLLLLGQGNR